MRRAVQDSGYVRRYRECPDGVRDPSNSLKATKPQVPGAPTPSRTLVVERPVVAFRNWRVVDGVLTSPHSRVAWLEPILCATCLRAGTEHEPPHPGCDCGVSAYHEPQLRHSTVDFRGVSGIVTLWGRLEVHDDRVRGEFARVEALALYSRWSWRQHHAVATVARELGAELIDLREQAEAAERYQRPSLASASR